MIKRIKTKAADNSGFQGGIAQRIERLFAARMDEDLNVKEAFDSLYKIVSDIRPDLLTTAEASGIIKAVKRIDEVLKVVF